jgi:hypothetical protein
MPEIILENPQILRAATQRIDSTELSANCELSSAVAILQTTFL